MPQHLTKMEIDRVSLVDRGANGRRFAILKSADGQRVTIRKDQLPTYADLAARAEFTGWLPDALDALSSVLWAAAYASADVTPAQRADAVIDAVDQFRAAVLERAAGTINKRHRGRPAWRGFA